MSALPRFLSEGILGNIVGTSQNNPASPPTGISRSFELFIQNINKASNRYEENQAVQRELQTVQQNISNPGISQVQLRDLLSRIIYCHMLGYDVAWGHIQAVKLAQQGTLLYKKIGYLTCCLLLHRDHDLILLLINTIQKDLRSSNLLDNLAALSAASQLVPAEMIPALLPVVLSKLKHPRVTVRQRAVMCLHQFIMQAPDLLGHNMVEIHSVLLDKDPGVVATYLHILQPDIQKSPEKHATTGSVMLKILNQLNSVRMDPMFDYHGLPFPWLRMHLIRCLTQLAVVHQSLKKDLASSLETTLLRLNLKENIGFALLYECIQCIVTIDPGPKLLDEAAKHVGRLLKSSDPNLKLIGVKSLVRLVQADRQYASDYQDLIVQSLKHADTSVQRKMYKVLFQISHAGNVEAIAAQMLQQLATSVDRYWRSEVITMVTDIASRFPDNAAWQVDTLYQCVQLGGREVNTGLTDSILDILQNNYMIDSVEVKRQQVLVQKSVAAIMSKDTTYALVLISAWVLGELCHLLKNLTEEKLLGLMVKPLCNTELTYHVKSYVLSAIQKFLSCQLVTHGCLATSFEECLQVKQPPVIKQRMVMLLGVCQHQMSVECVDPGLRPDTTLSFLDDYVSDNLEAGGLPYIPVHMRGLAAASQVSLPAYAEADTTDGGAEEEENLSVEDRPCTSSTTSSLRTMEDREPGLKISGVRQVWSKHGRLDADEPGAAETLIQEHQTSVEERQYKELSSALFAGLPSREKNIPEEPFQDNPRGFLSHSADTGGWRKLHEDSKTDNKSPDASLRVDEQQNSENQSYELADSALTRSKVEDTSQADLLENSNAVLDVKAGDCESIDRENSNDSNMDGSLYETKSESRTDEELSALMNDNSGFLNISVCSNDESRVSLSFIGDNLPGESLGEVNMVTTASHRPDASAGTSNQSNQIDSTNTHIGDISKQGCANTQTVEKPDDSDPDLGNEGAESPKESEKAHS